MKVLVLCVILGLSTAKNLDFGYPNHPDLEDQYHENRIETFKNRAMRLLGNTARELVQMFMEEKDRGTFTVESVKELTQSVRSETARMLPSIPRPNFPAKMALGLTGVVAGAAGVGYGARTVGRSLYDVYENIDIKQGIMAMSKPDFLERTFNWMNVHDEECKRKVICEVEQYASNRSSFKKYILRFLSHRHPGLARYSDAVDAGLDFYDCAAVYSGCSQSFLDLVGNIPLDRLGVNTDYVNSIPWALISEKIQVLKNVL